MIATIKSWNIENAKNFSLNENFDCNITLVTRKEDLTLELLEEIDPEYVFFPHWSWIIPSKIYSKYQCIIFHTADLPYGRGGSPIQNQIIRKIAKSKICAIRCVNELDAGDIYCKEDVNLSRGNIDEILMEISNIIFTKMIPYILINNPTPVKQKGEILEFLRRKKEDSEILNNNIESTSDLYDLIRMLDGEGYPLANLECGNLRFEFFNATKRSGYVEGGFRVYEK